MISLLRAEMRRFASRRLMRVLAAGALVLLVLILGRVAMVHSKSVRQVDVAEQQAEARQDCEEAKARGHAPPDFDCQQIVFGEDGTYIEDDRLHARGALEGAAVGVAIAVALMAFVAAASSVGADWHHGTMQALLFWEPRRGRVLFAKGLAVVAVPVAYLFALEAVAYAGTYLIAVTRGTTEGVTAGLHMSNLLLVLRAAVFVGVVALLGYAIAGLARITAAALGAAFVYFAIVENVIYQFRPAWERYLVSRNVAAILAKEVNVHPARRPLDGPEFGLESFYTLTGVRGATTLAVYLAILLGAYYLVFTRRDVT